MSQFDDLVIAIYRAARDVPMTEFQDIALTFVNSVIAFDSGRWGSSGIDENGIDFRVARLYNDDPESIEAYRQIESPDAPGLFAATHLGRAHNFHLSECFRARDERDWLEFARRFHHEQGMLTAIRNARTTLVDSVSLYRAHAARPFSERERLLCQRLVPHLVEAQAINRTLYAAQWGLESGGGMVRATAIADRKGVVHVAESGFFSLLQCEWPEWNGPILPGIVRQRLLEETYETFAGRAIILSRQAFDELVLLRVRPRSGVDDLTKRELEVAQQIAAGLSYKEIAQVMNIAPATVRNHIQAIHGRLQVRNNVELAAQLTAAGY